MSQPDANASSKSAPGASAPGASEDGKAVRIERLIDAPRELVFAAWTDAARLPDWFAPRGCAIEYRHLEIRPGGTFHSCIRSPEGHECWCVGEYLEVIPSERLVFTMAIADAQGTRISPQSAGMDPEWPAETTATVRFEAIGRKTRLTLEQTVLESVAKRTGAHPSWLQMLDRLEEQLRPS